VPAGLHVTAIGVVSAPAVLDSGGFGGPSPRRDVLLSIIVSLMGFAVLACLHSATTGKGCGAQNGKAATTK
jgi:hypothetical protein